MSLQFFVCDLCGTIDSIELSPWNEGYFCYQCSHGTWHGYFDQEKYSVSDEREYINRAFNLERPSLE